MPRCSAPLDVCSMSTLIRESTPTSQPILPTLRRSCTSQPGWKSCDPLCSARSAAAAIRRKLRPPPERGAATGARLFSHSSYEHRISVSVAVNFLHLSNSNELLNYLNAVNAAPPQGSFVFAKCRSVTVHYEGYQIHVMYSYADSSIAAQSCNPRDLVRPSQRATVDF